MQRVGGYFGLIVYAIEEINPENLSSGTVEGKYWIVRKEIF